MTDKTDIDNVRYSFETQEFFQRQIEEAINALINEKNQENNSLIKAMRHLDYTVNITWVMAHYNTAKFYIESKSGNSISTGGSDWHKYMHPKYQKRIFFPELWSKEELEKWGENE